MLVFLGVPWRSSSCSWWPFIQAGYYAMTDWTGFQANFNFIGFDNFMSLWDDDTFRKTVRNNIIMAIVVPVMIVISLTFATMISIGGSSRATCADQELELLPRGVVLPVRRPGDRDRADLEQPSTRPTA